MIELKNDILEFTFPEVHPKAKLSVSFQRTLRIPDDGNSYPLPPGLGVFPMRHVDDFTDSLPSSWIERGGVMMPMYQSEAMWLGFNSDYLDDHETSYPFAIKIATGKIDAITGNAWANQLRKDPQDYMVAPDQPWLDGYCVKKGIIRQFVAMPLGSGYSAEEQITGKSDYGGLQIMVFPMRREAFERHYPKVQRKRESEIGSICKSMAAPCECAAEASMGLSPGGQMEQEIYDDPYSFEDWDTKSNSRCFVHIANSLTWRSITKDDPPTVPFTAKEYTESGLPWFDYYDETAKAVKGSKTLDKLLSVFQMGKKKGDTPLPENQPVTASNVIPIKDKRSKDQVREGVF